MSQPTDDRMRQAAIQERVTEAVRGLTMGQLMEMDERRLIQFFTRNLVDFCRQAELRAIDLLIESQTSETGPKYAAIRRRFYDALVEVMDANCGQGFPPQKSQPQRRRAASA